MKQTVFISLIFVILSFSFSCKKDQLLTDTDAKLEFSEDTILFDTVFTTVGSATQVFTVHNTYSQPVNIGSLFLAGGPSSYFRLNVNGTPGKYFSNVEIGARDSIFIFVEVTLDPNNINTPLLVTDSIIFITNGNTQDIDLVAYGQDAHFYPSGCDIRSSASPVFILQNCTGGTNITWNNDKPHVIYGYAVVDSGYTLTIEAGTQVHFHVRSGLIVLSGGKLIVNGTLQNPVTIQGDRLGENFKDIPGQWDRIWLSNITHNNLFNEGSDIGPGPRDNQINYAIIKNGFVGIQSDTVAAANSPAVIINNSILKNFASTALFSQGSHIQANNSVFSNCGEYCAAIYFGGDYRFLHCTFANFWVNSNRQTPAVFMQNFYTSLRPLNSAYFGNCIIDGSLENEIGLDSANAPFGNFNFQFDHCILRISNQVSTNSAFHYINILKNQDPKFKDIPNNNFELDSTSIAVDYGNLTITQLEPLLSTDLNGNTRPQGLAPDLGALERR